MNVAGGLGQERPFALHRSRGPHEGCVRRLGSSSPLRRWRLQSFHQRLREQIASLSYPVGTFESMYDCELVSDLRFTEWEFVQVCRRVKRRGEDPRTWLNVSKNALLRPNLNILETQLGMRPIEQRRLLEKTPLVVTQYDTDDFVNRLGTYFGLGFSNAQVKRLFLAYPECLKEYFLAKVEGALKYYLDLGLIREEVVSVFEQVPSMLGGDFYLNLKPKLVWLEEVVGVDSNLILHDWLVKKPRNVLKADLGKLQENYDVFVANGFDRCECLGMFEEFPELLSGDKFDFQDKMDFLKQELGEPGYKEVLGWPIFFTYSYHRRITMRVAFLKYRGRDDKGFTLQSVLEAGTQRFVKRFARSDKRQYKLFTKEWKATHRIKRAQERWNVSET